MTSLWFFLFVVLTNCLLLGNSLHARPSTANPTNHPKWPMTNASTSFLSSLLTLPEFFSHWSWVYNLTSKVLILSYPRSTTIILKQVIITLSSIKTQNICFVETLQMILLCQFQIAFEIVTENRAEKTKIAEDHRQKLGRFKCHHHCILSECKYNCRCLEKKKISIPIKILHAERPESNNTSIISHFMW